jgi:ribosomal protein S18 acetylase RimI-like enzyme
MLFEIELSLRICREQDLPALEWMGLYTTQREIIRATFAEQERGEALMLLGVANEFAIAQAWLDFARRGSPLRPRLWALRVFPPLQHAGIGTWLLRAAEQLASSRGARAIDLGVERTNPHALRLYERLGYHAAGTRCDVVLYHFEGRTFTMTVDQHVLSKDL